MVLVAKVCIRKNSCVHKISQNEPFAFCLLRSKEHYKMKSFEGFILSLYFGLGKLSSIEIQIWKFEKLFQAPQSNVTTILMPHFTQLLRLHKIVQLICVKQFMNLVSSSYFWMNFCFKGALYHSSNWGNDSNLCSSRCKIRVHWIRHWENMLLWYWQL